MGERGPQGSGRIAATTRARASAWPRWRGGGGGYALSYAQAAFKSFRAPASTMLRTAKRPTALSCKLDDGEQEEVWGARAMEA